jgi:hypothetical protein
MAKSRKGLGKQYGKKFVEKQKRDAHIRVYSGSKNTTDKDFDIVFDSLTNKKRKK